MGLPILHRTPAYRKVVYTTLITELSPGSLPTFLQLLQGAITLIYELVGGAGTPLVVAAAVESKHIHLGDFWRPSMGFEMMSFWWYLSAGPLGGFGPRSLSRNHLELVAWLRPMEYSRRPCHLASIGPACVRLIISDKVFHDNGQKDGIMRSRSYVNSLRPCKHHLGEANLWGASLYRRSPKRNTRPRRNLHLEAVEVVDKGGDRANVT